MLLYNHINIKVNECPWELWVEILVIINILGLVTELEKYYALEYQGN